MSLFVFVSYHILVNSIHVPTTYISCDCGIIVYLNSVGEVGACLLACSAGRRLVEGNNGANVFP